MQMDEGDNFQDCHSHRSLKQPGSPYSVNYDNEEFYPETEEEAHMNPTPRRYSRGDPNDPSQIPYEENQMEPDEQQRLEKTIFHKAMIGIGPYLVEKAASVLEASRSYSGDLSYLPGRPPQGDNRNITRGNKPSAKCKASNSRSQSLTKGFQKLRITSSCNNKGRPVHSRGGSTSHFRFQRGYGTRKANNKSSSTSSIGRKPPPSKYPENSVNQRLLSARRGMIKELKCRVTELETVLKEMQKENQILQRLQHRHEVALSKYEGAEAELPRLIRSHLAEVKSLQENLRKAQSQNRNIDEKMKSRDQKIFRLEEENKSLVALVKQNNLEERSKLAEHLEHARNEQALAETRVMDLQRHLEILEKNHRFQISVEKKKLRTTNNKLFEAHQEIDKLYAALKEKDRIITCIRIRQGQGQMPIKGERTHIFQDDASLRSARTLPSKNPPPHYPKDPMSFHEEHVRRQRSETFGPNKSPQHPRQYRHHGSYYNTEEDHIERRVSKDIINPRQHLTDIHNARTPHQPVSPPSGRSERSKLLSEIPDLDESPLQSRSSMTIGQSRLETASILIADTDRTDRTVASERIEEVNDDEYYNFENVSVEDDNYHPHKSLFVDALDSSCNVSSGQSPMDSVRSHFNKNLRPSSAGPKFRLENLKSRPESKFFQGSSPKDSYLEPKRDDHDNSQETKSANVTVIQNHGGGDAPEVETEPSSRPITTGEPYEFISQRSSTANSHGSKVSKTASASCDSEDDFETSCEVSGRSGGSGKRKSISEIHVPDRKSDIDSAVIESIFTKWKHRQSNMDNQETQPDPTTDETTPRRKELLIQKLKDMDASRKKVEDIVPLTNPAYFPTGSDSNIAAVVNNNNNVEIKQGQFKSAYQPFFNNNNVEESDVTAEPNSGRKIKVSLPWLNTSSENLQERESLKEKIILKGQQHTSILEPRHSLSPMVSNSSDGGKFQVTPDKKEDLPRKKFTIGSISSSPTPPIQSAGGARKISSSNSKGKQSRGWK